MLLSVLSVHVDFFIRAPLVQESSPSNTIAAQSWLASTQEKFDKTMWISPLSEIVATCRKTGGKPTAYYQAANTVHVF